MKQYDVIIIGGSYSGLAAAMALGRALKEVLVIDSGSPCNKQTPQSHNFLTQDGNSPATIAAIAKRQVEKYATVSFLTDTATDGSKTADGFKIETAGGEAVTCGKLIVAAGIRDVLPGIEGLSGCWGISVLHCPYCHGYEARSRPTGVIGNGQSGFEFVRLISNWTRELTLFTNGPSTLSAEQTQLLAKQNINIVEENILRANHSSGYISSLLLANGKTTDVKALYVKAPFEQHCPIPVNMGCKVDPDGYIVTNAHQETSVSGIYAAGDNSSRMRTVANAVSSGTTAGMSASKTIILNQ